MGHTKKIFKKSYLITFLVFVLPNDNKQFYLQKFQKHTSHLHFLITFFFKRDIQKLLPFGYGPVQSNPI
jgi:hypothetical protein